eukprot:gene40989-54291_t
MARHATTPELKQRLDSAMETVTHALEASKRIMHNLRPAILEQGLVAALQWMANRFERRTGVACVFRTSHDNPKLPAGVPLVAYRTAQEALTNIERHAGASHIEISLTGAQRAVTLRIADDGHGFDTDSIAVHPKRGIGLRNMMERMEAIGGQFSISSSPAGTVLLAHILLVDDHPLVRDVLRARLEAVPQFEVVAEAGGAQEALEQARHCTVDLVLMDINMRGGNGIEATARFSE